MQKRGFLVLAAATMLCIALAVFATVSGDRFVSAPAAAHYAFPALSGRLGDVTSVELSRGKTRIDFNQVAKRWLIVEKGNYPAKAAKVRKLVLAFADLTLVEPKTQLPALYPRLDVEDPAAGKSTLVVLRNRKGQVLAQLIIGRQRYDRLGEGVDGVYVRKPGEARSWLARGSLDVSNDAMTWLDPMIVDIADQRIASVKLNDATGGSLVIDRAKPGAKFAIAGLPSGITLKNQVAIAEPATALEALEFTDVKPASVLAVPNRGVINAEFVTFHGLTVHLRVFRHDQADWASIEAAGTGTAAAESDKLNDKLRRWVYAIPGYKAQILQTTLGDLIAPPPKS